MKVLNGMMHGLIDYASVLIFALGPTVSGFTGPQAKICYVLAFVHLLLTLATKFPLGVLKAVPFPTHGAIELLVSILLVVLPWIAGFSAGVNSRNFFLFMGLIIFVVWLVTDYRGSGRTETASTPAVPPRS